MATFQIAKAKPVDLGQLGGQAAKAYAKKYAPKQSRKPKTYFVVSRGFANKFAGGQVGSINGSLFGVFTNFAAAQNFVKANKLALHAAIVSA